VAGPSARKALLFSIKKGWRGGILQDEQDSQDKGKEKPPTLGLRVGGEGGQYGQDAREAGQDQPL
jgi:hypothetical protein